MLSCFRYLAKLLCLFLFIVPTQRRKGVREGERTLNTAFLGAKVDSSSVCLGASIYDVRSEGGGEDEINLWINSIYFADQEGEG